MIKHIFYLLDEDMLFYCLFNGHCLYTTFRSTAYLLAPRHAPAKFAPTSGTKRKGSAYIGSFGALATLQPQGTLPLSSPRLAVLNASFASLAFVKYRGTQIALWEGDRQCSLILEYKRRGWCAVFLCIRICQRVRMEWKGCAVPFYQPCFYIIHIRILSECGV